MAKKKLTLKRKPKRKMTLRRKTKSPKRPARFRNKRKVVSNTKKKA